MSQYYGAGVTGFGLIGSRALDSMGLGVGLSKLNQNLFRRDLFAATFLQPTVTYIPTPGLSPTLADAPTTTLRLTVLF